MRTTRFVFAPTVLTLLTGALLTSAASAVATVSVVPSHLSKCYVPDPRVIAEELPPIFVPSTPVGGAIVPSKPDALDGTRTGLVLGGPLAYTPVAATIPGGHLIAGPTLSGKSRNILLAGISTKGGQVLFATSIGGSGDDVAHSIAVGSKGEIIITGTTTSQDLPVTSGKPSKGNDGFVLILDPSGQKVLGGSYLSGGGNETISDLIIAKDGTMLIAGTLDGKLPTTASKVTVTTLFPTDIEETQTYFVGSLSQKMVPKIDVIFQGPKVLEPEVWLDCNGNIVVGVPVINNTPCPGSGPITYTMSNYDGNYTNDQYDALGPIGGMGFHALRWKFYRANDKLNPGEPPIELDWDLAPSPGQPGEIPVYVLTCDKAPLLNTLEGIVFTQDGQTVNPPGTWECDQHDSVQTLALRSAYYASRWDTPTYSTTFNLSGDPTRVAIEKTTFEVQCDEGTTYNGEQLEDICDFTVNTVGELTCAGTDDGVIAGGLTFSFKEFEVSLWDPSFWYFRFLTWENSTARAYSAEGDHIFDPPEDDPNGMAVIRAATARMRSRMVRPVEVTINTYQGGVLIASQTGQGLVHLSQLP